MEPVYRFDGEHCSSVDGPRLSRQLIRVKEYMRDGEWRTLRELEDALGYPQASISARLRDLRKPRFGSLMVERRRRGEGRGTYEYRVAPTLFAGLL